MTLAPAAAEKNLNIVTELTDKNKYNLINERLQQKNYIVSDEYSIITG